MLSNGSIGIMNGIGSCCCSVQSLAMLELRPILPAVTPLAVLALWLAFRAVPPQHSYDARPTNGKAPRASLASAEAGLAREVSFHAS